MTIANQCIITAKADQEKSLKSELNALIARSLLEKGCQKFELYQLYDAQDKFFIIEIWKSERSYKKHLEGREYLQHKEMMQQYIDSEIVHPLKLTQCLTQLGLKEKKENK